MNDASTSGAPVIFNVVLTGNTFWHLRYFVCSIIEQSDARVRLILNACTPESTAQIQEFARSHADRVVEVFEASSSRMIAHGVCLDAVRGSRDDGPLFCLIDPDIKARTSFLGDFRELLASFDAVTSGNEVWTDDNVVPVGALGIGGRHFYNSRGFVLGSPHFAMYRAAALDEVCARWGIGLGSAGPELSDAARARLADAGHAYAVYDTGKIVNILFQLEGHRLRHFDHPELVHIGGLSHFISPPEAGAKSGEVETPTWSRFGGMEARLEVARYTALVMRATIEQRPAPPLPPDLDPSMRARLELVRTEMIDLVERYRAC